MRRHVRVHPDVRLAFGDAPVEGANLTVRSDFNRHNFDRVEPGMVLGWLGPPGTWPFDARGGDGVEVSAELFTSMNGLVRIRRAMVPVMMTVLRRSRRAIASSTPCRSGDGSDPSLTAGLAILRGTRRLACLHARHAREDPLLWWSSGSDTSRRWLLACVPAR